MFSLIRAASIVTVVALHEVLPDMLYFSVFASILFGHYGLSLWYARRRAKPIVSGRVSIAALVALIVVVVLPPALAFPSLIVYHGIHNALSDGYMVAGGKPDQLDARQNRLLWARMALIYAAYLVALRLDPEIAVIPDAVMIGAVALTFAAFIITLLPLAPSMGRRKVADMVAFELMWVGAAYVVSFGAPRLFDLIFYHIMVWVFLPFLRIPTRKGRINFAVQTVVAALIVFPFTPWVGVIPRLHFQFWVAACALGGYLHVSTSFAFSPFNPRWVVRFFSGKGGPAATPRRPAIATPTSDTSPA